MNGEKSVVVSKKKSSKRRQVVESEVEEIEDDVEAPMEEVEEISEVSMKFLLAYDFDSPRCRKKNSLFIRKDLSFKQW